MGRIEDLIKKHCPDGVEYTTLGEICSLSRGRVMSKDYLRDNVGDYPVYSSQTANNGVFGKINTYDQDGTFITWTTDGAKAGSVFYREKEKFSITNVCGLISDNSSEIINLKFLYYVLSVTAKGYVYRGMGNPKLMSNVMSTIRVPVPPLTVQQEIIDILDEFTKLEAELATELEAELTARRKQYAYYRDSLLSFNKKHYPDGVKFKKIAKVCDIANNKRKPVKSSIRVPGKTPYYGANNIQDSVEGFTHDGNYVLIAEDGSASLENYSIQYTEGKFWANNHIHVIKGGDELNNRFLFHYLKGLNFRPFLSGGNRAKLTKTKMIEIKIPIPALPVQQEIVDILDRFTKLEAEVKAELEAELEARRRQYEHYRNRLLTFQEAV